MTHNRQPNLERLAADLKARLDWRLHEKIGRNRFEIVSDPVRREHVLFWPRPGNFDPPRYLEYLHELVHARMAEQVHPLFSGSAFVPGSDPKLVNATLCVFQAASDWFVEWELLEVCPERKAAELIVQYRSATRRLRGAGALDKRAAVELALLAAKGVVFLDHSPPSEGPLCELLDAFRRTPAHKPSLFTLRALVNRLLGTLFGARAEVKSTPTGHAWLLVSPAAADVARQPAAPG